MRLCRFLTLGVVGDTDCVENPKKFHFNSPVNSARGYWNRLELLLSDRKFVKANCSCSTTIFHMLALPLGRESQTLHRKCKCVWDDMACA